MTVTAAAPARTEYEVAVDVVAKLFVDGVIPWDGRRAQAACASAGVEPADVRDAYNGIKRNGSEYRKPGAGEADPRPLVSVDPDPARDRLENRIVDLQRKLTAESEKLHRAAAELVELREERAEHRQEIESLRAEIAGVDDQQARIGKLEAEIADLQHELALATGTWEPARGGVTRKTRGRGNTKKMREANPAPGVRRCSRCKQNKPADQDHFYLKNERTGQLSSMCIVCRVEYSAERYLSVKRIAAMNRAGIEFTIRDDDDVAGLQCSNCKRPLEAGQLVHGKVRLDHVDCKNPGG